MGQDSNRQEFELKKLLDSLREKCGDSEFGYRMQAMFAHLMLRRGAKILEVNAQGHPDVRGRMADTDYLVQVKTSLHSSAATIFELSAADLIGIRSEGRAEGMLAFLDSAAPIGWIIVRYERAKWLLGKEVHIATLRADSDKSISADYSSEFMEVLTKIGGRLHNLTFPLLRRRALEGNAI